VNKHGLLLTDKDILQGIYLDNTVVAVSNDNVLLNKSEYDPNFKLEVIDSVNNLRVFSQNLQNLSINVNASVILDKGYKAIGYSEVKYVGRVPSTHIDTAQYTSNDALIIPDPSIVRIHTTQSQTWFGLANNYLTDNTVLSGPNDAVNTMPLNNTAIETAGTAFYFQTALFGIQDLLDFYNEKAGNRYGTINTFESQYLKKVFDRNFGSTSWNATTIVNTFRQNNISNTSQKMFYTIKMTGTNQCIATDLTSGDYEFQLEDASFDSINNTNIKMYDFILPRMDSSGRSNGSLIGLILLVINGQSKNYTKRQ
jgi:hypothetical protein